MKFTIEKLRQNVLMAIGKDRDHPRRLFLAQPHHDDSATLGLKTYADVVRTTTPDDDNDATFHDALQSVVAATQPQTDDDVVPCCHRVLAAADAADNDASRWKLLVRAPEAKRVIRAKNNEKKDKKATRPPSTPAGTESGWRSTWP